MTTTAASLRELARDNHHDISPSVRAKLLEAAAFIERSCNTGQGVGEMLVDALKNAKGFLDTPVSRRRNNGDSFYEETVRSIRAALEAALAARIPEASVEQAGRSSAEPVASVGRFIDAVQSDDFSGFLDGKDGAVACARDALSALAPPAGRQEAVAMKAHWLVTYEDGRQQKCAINPGLGKSGNGYIVSSVYVPDSPSGADLGGEVERLRTALVRQADNMAFVINHVTMPDLWRGKFMRELDEDREALSSITPAAGEDATPSTADEKRCRWPACNCYGPQAPNECRRASLSGAQDEQG